MSIMGTIKSKAPWLITTLSIIAVVVMPFIMGGEMDKTVTMPSGNVIKFKVEVPDESKLTNLIKDCDFQKKEVGAVCPIEFKIIATLEKKGIVKSPVKENPDVDTIKVIKDETVKPDNDIINK